MRRFHLFFCVLILIALISGTGAVQGQDNLKFDRLQVDIWPEYDRPDVLIIYRIELSPQTTLPVKMIMRIPRAAGKPHSVAMLGVDGLLYNLDYTITVEGEWLDVTFTTLSPEVHIEYYDPRLIRQGDRRIFEYQWPGDYSIEEIIVQMQQPRNASNLNILPDVGMGREGQDGLIYYTIVMGAINEGTPLDVRLSYEKDDDSLSQDLQSVQPEEPIMSQSLGWLTFLEVLPWALGVLGLLLIVGGGFWYWQSGHTVQIPITKLRSSTTQKQPEEKVEKRDVYCFDCGKRAMPGDIYCRSCGAKLNRKD